MTSDELDEFMCDPELAQALEQSRITDDIFDVIKLRENQHSDMLAWCLNPHEGHGQGDAIIKDFLIAAYEESYSSAFGNRRFFDKWRPAKIRTTSFGAAFLTRELGVSLDKEGKRGRLDLFLVDPMNKIIVTIENKAGRKLSPTQLEDYWKAVKDQVATRPAFKGYQFAYIVLDRELDDDVDRTEHGRKWIILDYRWLETSATRARSQVNRSNQSAQLLMSYCQRQTDWQAEGEQRLVNLSASLAVKHEPVIARMRELKRTRIAEWTPKMRTGDAELILFLNQHRQACEALVAGRGIAAIAADIRKIRPDLAAEHLDVRRVWLAITSPSVDRMIDTEVEEPLWPIYVLVRRDTADESERTLFKVRLIWVTSAFASHINVNAVRTSLEVTVPELAKRKSRNVRRITFASKMEAGAATTLALEVLGKLDKALRGLTVAAPLKR